MGRVGSALDNAISESFVATLKAELVSRCRFPSREVAKTAIFEYLEAYLQPHEETLLAGL
jgi:putative transposase